MNTKLHAICDSQGRPLDLFVTAGQVSDPWSDWLPHILPQFRHLFDFGQAGTFHNARARQGVAVFWSEFLDYFPNAQAWDRDRRFLRTVVHELGHALNLAHAWLVNRAHSTSFMQYPQRYPHGANFVEKDANYWRDFDYAFDPEELFHTYPLGEYPFTPDQFSQLVEQRHEPTVAHLDGRLLGFACFYNHKPGRSVFIGNLLVAP